MKTTPSDLAGIACILTVTPTSIPRPSAKMKNMVVEYANNHGVSEAMLSGSKKLLPEDTFDSLKPIMKNLTDWLEANTSPWKKGERIIQAKRVPEGLKFLADTREQYHRAAAPILQNWDVVRDNARSLLNGDFDPSKFPELEDMADKLTITFEFKPLATASDWRFAAPQEIIDIQNAALMEAADEHAKYCREQAVKAIHLLKRKCDEWEEGKSKLYDSTFDDVKDLVDFISGLVISDDPELMDVCARARAMLSGLEPDDIKKSAYVRGNVATQAADLLRSLGAA